MHPVKIAMQIAKRGKNDFFMIRNDLLNGVQRYTFSRIYANNNVAKYVKIVSLQQKQHILQHDWMNRQQGQTCVRIQILELCAEGVVTNTVLDNNELSVLNGLDSLALNNGVVNSG